jgi:hypothetical protein
MRLELLNGQTFNLDITPTEPFSEIHDRYRTTVHLGYYFTTLDANIAELAVYGRLADVQLWDGDSLKFRGDAVVTLLRKEDRTYHGLLDALSPFWHEAMKAH